MQYLPQLPGLQIPHHDYVVMTYVGVTNNIATVIYKLGGSSGTVVATLTMAYVASGVADDDDLLTVTRT